MFFCFVPILKGTVDDHGINSCKDFIKTCIVSYTAKEIFHYCLKRYLLTLFIVIRGTGESLFSCVSQHLIILHLCPYIFGQLFLSISR